MSCNSSRSAATTACTRGSASFKQPIDLTNFADRIIRGLASNLKELGVDDLVIQRMLRHGDVGTTRKSYIKVRNMKVEDAMRQLTQAFEALYRFCTASGAAKAGKLMKTCLLYTSDAADE